MVSTIAAYVTGAEKPTAFTDEQWNKAMEWAKHALDYSGVNKDEFDNIVVKLKTTLEKGQ